MPHSLILDMDPGVDDALALALALRCPQARVLGISTVAGNCGLAAATRNARIVLRVLGCEGSVPVWSGAGRPLAGGTAAAATEVHGGDGLGGVSRLYARPEDSAGLGPEALRRPAAHRWILQTLGQAEPRPAIVTTGPLTNLALALRRDRTALGDSELFIMGGAFGCPGNVNPTAEFNVYADPEAAQEVMASGVRQTWIPLDVTETVVLTEDRLRRWSEGYPGPLSTFLLECTREYLAFHRTMLGLEGVHVHDALAVAAGLWPDLFEFVTVEAAVETRGRLTRGQTVADLRQGSRPWGEGHRVRVAVRVDGDAFLERFEQMVFGQRHVA